VLRFTEDHILSSNGHAASSLSAAHTLDGTREGLDVLRVGFFRAEVVRASEMLGDFVELVIVFLSTFLALRLSLFSGV